MSRSTNVSGKTYLLMVLTPIRPDEQEALRGFLESVYERGPSPLERLARTHVARWLILPDMPQNSAAMADHLDMPYLLFTSAFDGDRDSYFDELVEALAPEAREIWGRCVGCPDPAAGAALKDYLKHNQLDAGFFFAAYGQSTVAGVKRALDKRERLIAFLLSTQGMEPAPLQEAFVREFSL